MPAKSSPLDFLKPSTQYATKEQQQERMSICEACPELFELTLQCKECMCIMPLKTKLAHAECPLGKWKAVNV